MQGFLATALHTPERGRAERLKRHVFTVDEAGVIAAVEPLASAAGAAAAGRLRAEGRLTELPEGRILLPGLVDLHVHAPQWPQLGSCLDLPLEDWLQRYTFPLEARYADLDHARAAYPDLVATLLANGTTTACYFATIHNPASLLLAETCLALGQRALVGRVAMDEPSQCPAWYRDASAEAAAQETRAFIEAVRALPGNEHALVRPVVTPRFIPACSDDLLRRLGALAAETGAPIQTHCSESDWEHGHVLARCGVTDTAALAGYGLLTRRTILAHGNLVGPADRALIRAAGAAIAHCPLSNAFFSDAVFPLRRALDEGLHVGLGTDIAGGPSPSLLDNARQAVVSARMLESGVDPERPGPGRGRPGARISALEAFWLATAGGGKALDLPIGLLRPGYAFDAIEIEAGAGNLRIRPEDPPEAMVEKIVHLAGRAAIGRVWVGARAAGRA